MAKPTIEQVKQAYAQRPDLKETFYDPSSGGYAKPGKGDWSIYDWGERYGAQELPDIFGKPAQNIQQPITPITTLPILPAPVATPTLPASIESLPFSEGSLIRQTGTPEVYAITPEGTRRHITNPEEFEKEFGASAWNQIKPVTAEQLQKISLSQTQQGIIEKVKETFSPNIPLDIDTGLIGAGKVELSQDIIKKIKEGSLIRGVGVPEVYQIQGDTARHLQMTAEQFESMGYDWSRVQEVVPSILDSFEKGIPITAISDEVQAKISPWKELINSVNLQFQQEKIEANKAKEEMKVTQGKITEAFEKLSSKIESFGKSTEQLQFEKELSNNNQTIIDTETLRDRALQISKGRKAPMSFIRGEQGNINDSYNIELKALYSKKSALEGSIDRASSLAKDSLDLILKSEEIKLQTLQNTLSIQSDYYKEIQDERKSQQATLMQLAIVQEQSKIERAYVEQDNKANTYATIISTYGSVMGLDNAFKNKDVTAAGLWELASGAVAQKKLLETAKDLKTLGYDIPLTYEELGVVSESGKMGTRNWRNNNPGNIEYGEFAKSEGAIGTDGRFAIFRDAQTGEIAMRKLLQGDNYKNLTVDAALRKWSGGDYGSIIIPSDKNIDSQAYIRDLDENKFNSVVESIKTQEGWYNKGNIYTDSTPLANVQKTMGEAIGMPKTVAEKFNEVLRAYTKKAYEGGYGYQGVREQIYSSLISDPEFYQYRDGIGEIIYGSNTIPAVFPDGYEYSIGTKVGRFADFEIKEYIEEKLDDYNLDELKQKVNLGTITYKDKDYTLNYDEQQRFLEVLNNISSEQEKPGVISRIISYFSNK